MNINLIPNQVFTELHNVRFHVSNLCNLNCRYCHVFKTSVSDKAQLMKFNVIKPALDFYAKLNATYSNQIFKFSFYGGEPLFNWKVIKKALSYGNRMIPGRIEWILNTNGTIITQDKAQTLFKEGVDVHVSIDGPDEKTNRNRLFKTGRPVLKKVLNSLEILLQNNCKVQFDSCLTMANIDALESLIDLASQNRVDRIYLALTDEPGMQNKDSFNTDNTADLLIKALKYAEKKKVVLGGPWKCFFPWFLPQSNTIVKQHPHLIVDASGNLYFPSFPELKFGNVTQIETISETKTYKDALKKTADMAKTCKGCDLSEVCSGYLKEMVKYHTGSFKGYERECELTKAVYYKYSQLIADIQTENNVRNISSIDSNVLEKPFIHSRHLKIQAQENNYKIVHQLSGFAIKASEDMLEFIDAFKDVSRPATLLERYHIPNLSQIVQMLLRNHVLIPATRDEELEYLNRKMSTSTKKSYETTNCLCLYSPKDRMPAEKFAQLIQKLYSNMKTKFKPLRQKMIIYVAEKRAELTQFWFEPVMPPWINGFVALHRILVVDINKIKNDDWRTSRFKAGMTHEIIHMLLGNLNICLPIWLEEGLCEYFSKNDPTPKLLNLMKRKKLLTFKQLEAKATHTLLDIDNSKTDDNICYHQAHSFVAYLCESLGEDEFISWIGTLGLNSELEHDFAEYSENSLADLEQEWFHKVRSSNHLEI